MSDIVQVLRKQVFPETGIRVFTVLDGASVPDLVPKLFEFQPEYFCLYLGELAPDMAEVAPYLVYLQTNSPFAEWVIERAWGKHWGILVHSYSDLRSLRRHFRKFLTVHDNGGKPLLFRYYDPRVLRVYLPSCNAEELQTFFGPIETFVVEDEDPTSILKFSLEEGRLKQTKGSSS